MRNKIIILIFLFLAPIGYSYLIEPNALTIEERVFKLDCLEEDISGQKIIQISDLHFTGKTSENRIERIFRAVENLKPAAVFITGDFISEEAGIGPAVKLMGKISDGAPIYAVFGNWDYWALNYNAAKLKKELESSGVKVLLNETVALKLADQVINLIGVRDTYTSGDSKSDLEAAMKEIADNDKNCRLLLAHSPDIAGDAADKNIDLILTGHTHGGQVNIPFITERLIPVRYPSTKGFIGGLYKIEETRMYINRGIGTSVLPLRFLSSPEITFITLSCEMGSL